MPNRLLAQWRVVKESPWGNGLPVLSFECPVCGRRLAVYQEADHPFSMLWSLHFMPGFVRAAEGYFRFHRPERLYGRRGRLRRLCEEPDWQDDKVVTVVKGYPLLPGPLTWAADTNIDDTVEHIVLCPGRGGGRKACGCRVVIPAIRGNEEVWRLVYS